jgi:hypothetical protein
MVSHSIAGAAISRSTFEMRSIVFALTASPL